MSELGLLRDCYRLINAASEGDLEEADVIGILGGEDPLPSQGGTLRLLESRINDEEQELPQPAAGPWRSVLAPKDGRWILAHNWFGDFVAVRWDADSNAWIDVRGQSGFEGDPDPWAPINLPEVAHG